jgi:FkbM family methyltransferase
MTRTATFEITGGARVVVPDSLHSMTPYILYEQHDWFEDEIDFLRRLIKPGQQVIDIGANYGVYTLSLAKLVGPTGAIWAFEPGSTTADYLAQGIAANNFTHVALERSAVSSRTGTAVLSLNDNSELNSLTLTSDTDKTETVRVVTLDQCLRDYGWRNITLLKIDAEGEEVNIIEGAKKFFAALSPLVLYEIKAGRDFHLDLVRRFADIGYDSYRLIPGLNLLVPFGPNTRPDEYLLNLFCCKEDRAASLANEGFLVDSSPATLSAKARDLANFLETKKTKYLWQQALVGLPYVASLLPRWMQATESTDREQITDAMACFAISHDTSLVPHLRFAALERGLSAIREVCRKRPSHLRLLSLARIASSYGSRQEAVTALSQLCARVGHDNPEDFDEPFLAPNKRFDSLNPNDNLRTWLVAGVLEELELLATYSSYFNGDDSRLRLEMIATMGFASPEMQRRLQLIQVRFPATAPTV